MLRNLTPREEKLLQLLNSDKNKELRNILSIAFVTLSENGSIDEVTASEHTDVFTQWEDGIVYKANEIRRYNENLYKCLQGHTSQADWTPDVSVSLWKKIGDPTEEFPEWSRPIGASDAYMKGDKVTFENKHYESIIDGNVWSPTEYTQGWKVLN